MTAKVHQSYCHLQHGLGGRCTCLPPTPKGPPMKPTIEQRIRDLNEKYQLGLSETVIRELVGIAKEEAKEAEIVLIRKAVRSGITMDDGALYNLVPAPVDVPVEPLEAEFIVNEDWSTITISGTPELVKRMLHIEDPE